MKRPCWIAVLILMGVLSDNADATMSWRPCEGREQSVVTKTVTLMPDPPVIGSPATFTVEAESGVAVTAGTVEIAISFAGTEIFSKLEDLCTKTTCPVAKGPVTITLIEDLPPIAPPGEYGLRLVARGPEENELLCLFVEFELVYQYMH